MRDETNYFECPTEFENLGKYLFTCGDEIYLDNRSNLEAVFGHYSDGRHTLKEALCELIAEHVDAMDIWNAIKNKEVDDLRLVEDETDDEKVWSFECRNDHGRWCEIEIFEESELEEADTSWLAEQIISMDDLIYILSEYGEDIFCYEFSIKGCIQGDFLGGIAFCTKEMFEEKICGGEDSWKKWAEGAIKSELEELERWSCSEVYYYVLEERITPIDEDDEDDWEDEDSNWREIESCGGFYCEPEEIIAEYLPECA